MTAWTKDELDLIGNAEEVEITPLQRDGGLGQAVIVWVVRVGDDLYIRSYRAAAGAWFRAALATRAGRLRAAGIERDILFVDQADATVNDQIDAVYRAKYSHEAQYVPPMVSPQVRATTLKLLPT